MFRIGWAFAYIIAFYSTANAQDTCTLKATIIVTEQHTNTAVAFATITNPILHLTAATDENGTLILENICKGNYFFQIQSFETKDTSIMLYISESGTYRLRVTHNDNLLHQIVITDQSVHTILQNKESLDEQKLKENAGKTISEILKNVNGVSTMSNGANVSKPLIHGLHSNRILMLNNGVRQEDQQWGAEHAPNIDPFVASNITVLKGAAGVRYGTDAIGGVILVEPKPIRSLAGWQGELNLAAFSNNKMGVVSGSVEHRLVAHPEYAFRVQGTLKQGGNYQLPGGIYVANTGMKEANFSSTFTYKGIHKGVDVFYSRFANTVGIYTGSHTGSMQDLQNAINSPKPLVEADFSYKINRPKQVVSHDLIKIKSYLDNHWGVWNLTYAFQHNYRREYDIVRKDDGNAQLNLRLNTQSLNLNLDHKKTGNIMGQVGADWSYQHNKFDNGDRLFIPSFNAISAAAYAIERYSKSNWTAEAGVRFDYKHYNMFNPEGPLLQNVLYQFDYKNPSATLAFKQQINKRLDWMITLANAWRAPQAPELFSAGLHQAGARIELGDKNLKPEHSLSLNIGGNYSIENKLNISVSLYSQAIQNYIFLKPSTDVLTIRGYFKSFNYTQTNAQLSGVDASINYQVTEQWSANAKLSLLRGWDKSQKEWLILMPADRLEASIKFDKDLSQKFKNCFAEMKTQYVLQQKRVPNNFDQIDFPRPPAAYFLINASIGTSLVIRKQQVNWRIEATNILNTNYRDYLDLFRYFLNQSGRNISLKLNLPIN